MNKNVIKTMLFLGVFSVTVAISAQEGDKKAKPAPSPEKVMKYFDTNKDGSISKEEAESNEKKGILKRFDKLDKDKNGMISLQELKENPSTVAMKGQKNENKGNGATAHEKMLTNFDTNKDGTISKQEAELNDNKNLFNRFDKVDKNKNGSISREELKEMIEARAFKQ